jgi:uncharacterized membrane protein
MRINSAGVITGSYLDNRLTNHGFVRDAKGIVTTFDVAGAFFPTTTPSDINSSGTIVGSNNCCAFVRTADGGLAMFVFPGATGTSADAINAGGSITGTYPSDLGLHGYVRTIQGAFETFDVPGASSTIPTDISPEGTIIGQALVGVRSLAFVRSADGALTTFGVSDATNGTFPRAINPAGTITGFYQDDALRAHGFVRTRDGTITTFDVGPDGQTLAFDINPAGVIVGVFGNGSQSVGFIRDPLGKFTSISVPGSFYASAHAINAAGVVAGVGGGQGFVRDGRGTITTFGVPPQAVAEESDPINPEQRDARASNEVEAIRQQDAKDRVTFVYTLPANSDASIAVYDIAGRRVADLLDHVTQVAGAHEVSWSTAQVARGVYFFRLTAGALTRTKTLVVLH